MIWNDQHMPRCQVTERIFYKTVLISKSTNNLDLTKLSGLTYCACCLSVIPWCEPMRESSSHATRQYRTLVHSRLSSLSHYRLPRLKSGIAAHELISTGTKRTKRNKTNKKRRRAVIRRTSRNNLDARKKPPPPPLFCLLSSIH